MPTINIKVKDKIAKQVGNERYVCGNSDFTVEFEFDSEWDAYPTKTARFRYNGVYQKKVFTGNSCPVPVIFNAGAIAIGVYAGDLRTTTAAIVEARHSILDGDSIHEDPPEDLYNQLLEELSKIASKKDLPPITASDNGKVMMAEDGQWKAKTLPEIDADNIKFTKDLITTYEIGSISLENGQAVIPAEGKTLQEVWDTIFVTEKNPTVEEPKVLLTASDCKPYEVGTKVSPEYGVSLSAGSYSFGPDTGITASAWSVKDTLGVELTSSVGAFSTLVVRDDTSYSITATATHGAGAIPFTNLGNEYPEGQIAAGEKSATSAAITGYRNGFYGTAADKEAAIDSSFVRGLASKSGKTPAAGNVWNLAIPVGAMRIVFAYPATIRDVSSVLDVNGLNAEIKSAFTKYTVSVEGANGYEGIDYKVYVLDRAAATTEANTFKITI